LHVTLQPYSDSFWYSKVQWKSESALQGNHMVSWANQFGDCIKMYKRSNVYTEGKTIWISGNCKVMLFTRFTFTWAIFEKMKCWKWKISIWEITKEKFCSSLKTATVLLSLAIKFQSKLQIYRFLKEEINKWNYL